MLTSSGLNWKTIMRRIPHTMTQLFWTTSEVWATVERAWGGLELRNNRFLVRGEKKERRGAVRWQETVHLCICSSWSRLRLGLPSYLWAWDSCPPSSQWWPPAAARSPPPPARRLPSAAGCCRKAPPGTRPQQSSTFGRPEEGTRTSGPAGEKFLPTHPDSDPWDKGF